MKHLTILLTIVITSLCHARTWISDDGRKLEADFVSAGGGTVTLKRIADGQTLTLPLIKLSAADQKWITTTAKPAVPPKPVAGPLASLITGDWALSEYQGLPFALYAAKDLSASKKYPLVLALHGMSDNNKNGLQVDEWMKSFAKPENYALRPCIIVVPLCYQPHGATGAGWTDKPGVQAVNLVKKLMRSLPVDAKRIYVIGHSMGGFGTCHLMIAEPRLFAAGVAISGCSGVETADLFKRKPLWIFHAADDGVVSVKCARDLAQALEHSKTFKFTEYPDGGHLIADRVLATPELHPWLFTTQP